MKRIVVRSFKNKLFELTVSKIEELQSISIYDAKRISLYMLNNESLTFAEINDLETKYNIKLDSINSSNDFGIKLELSWDTKSDEVYCVESGFNIFCLLSFEDNIPKDLVFTEHMDDFDLYSAEFFSEENALFYYEYIFNVYQTNKDLIINKLKNRRNNLNPEQEDYQKLSLAIQLLE